MPSSKRKIASLKGQRSRLGTAIEKSIQEADDLIEGISTQRDDLDIGETTKEHVNLLSKLLKKYEDMTMKMAEIADDADDIDDDFEEDGSRVMDLALEVTKKISKLEALESSSVKEITNRLESTMIDGSGQEAIQKQIDSLLEIERIRAEEDGRRRSSTYTTSSQIRLPKIEFCKFSGDIIKWPEFWDSFEASVDRNENLQPVEKLSYLRSKLQDEALIAIEGIQTTNENYKVAVKLLKKRYGNSQLLITTHYRKMMDLPPAQDDTTSLRHLHDQLEKHLRCLEALGEDISHRHFISLIMAKLPWQVVAKLEEFKDDEEVWTVKLLRRKLQSQLAAREIADHQCLDKAGDKWEKTGRTMGLVNRQFQPRQFETRATAEALLVGDRRSTIDLRANSMSRTRCVLCSGNHWNDECRRFPDLRTRKTAIKGRCYICLSDSHLLKDCNMKYRQCVHCKQAGNHHRSLCPKRFGCDQEAMAMVPECEESGQHRTALTSSDEVLLASGEKVLLQTALCGIQKKGGEAMQIRVLLDSGSHRSYISESLARRLHLKHNEKESISVVTFGSSKPRTIETAKAEIVLKATTGFTKEISVNIVPKISGNISSTPVSLDDKSYLWNNLLLADTFPRTDEVSPVDCLIGSDYYLDIVTSEKIKVKDGLYLLGSKLGWILTGRSGQPSSESDTTLYINSHINQSTPLPGHNFKYDTALPVSPNMEDFWKLETIGIKDPVDTSDDDVAMKQFEEKIKYVNGRYEAGWPWKKDVSELPTNFQLAFGRFKSTCRRLAEDNNLLQKYDKIIKEQESKGIIEKVQDDKADAHFPVKHYIPHHPVISPKKTRIVYDASAKANKSDISLNECLLRGPVLLQDLCGLLLRFRLHQVVLLADIEKAFLQIGLRKEDKDVTRFFWLKDASIATPTNNTQIYRFCRVPFGVISSPFLLAATVKHHLQHSQSRIANQLCQDIYVDNVVTGVQDAGEAIKFYTAAKRLFSDASMNLREWSSNCKEFVKLLPDEDKIEATTVKVLGLKWNTNDDIIQIASKDKYASNQACTKREVLRGLAINFDPLGFFVPVTIGAKLLLQKVWESGVKWDEVLPEKLEEEWSDVRRELSLMPNVCIRRHIPLEKSKRTRLLCFCDASVNAYAAAVYVQYQTNNGEQCWVSRLVFEKSRIAPKRKLSIPRLELLGVLIGTRCLKFVEQQLPVIISEQILWTDSKCVLHWIKTKKPLSVFVENRIREIRNCSNLKFRYVKTTDNPADIATRVQQTEELANNTLWWEGPTWLSEDSEKWPLWHFDEISAQETDQVSQELRGTKVMFEAGMTISTSSFTDSGFLTIDCSKFSSLRRLLRVSSWILRFLRKLKPGICNEVLPDKDEISDGAISARDLCETKHLWERYVQNVHFKDNINGVAKGKDLNLQHQLGLKLDANGLLRCQGRLVNAEVGNAAKFPKLLPKKCHFTDLVIERCHKLVLHAGVSHTLAQVRQDYWIPQGRAAVRAVISRCQICRKHDGGPFQTPPMPPLPDFRVKPSPPFSFTGLDYFGPMYVKIQGILKKIWVCLFTCLCVRAIHLEVVGDLTADQFLLALRRFIARRGAPIQLFSDNAPQFKAANTTLLKLYPSMLKDPNFQSLLSDNSITWRFIPEFAPWMGGYYERLVGIVKKAMKKSLGRLLLTEPQFSALLTEIEAVVNSRPLVYVGDDVNSTSVLCPAHFLSLNPRSSLPPADLDDNIDPNYNPCFNSSSYLRGQWFHGQRILQSFWDGWEKDYLMSLREKHQPNLKTPKVTTHCFPFVGQVVLIRDGQSPRNTWKTGRIAKLILSSDGCIRSVKLHTSKKRCLIRPIRNLFPLEIQKDGEPDAHGNSLIPGVSAQSVPISKLHSPATGKVNIMPSNDQPCPLDLIPQATPFLFGSDRPVADAAKTTPTVKHGCPEVTKTNKPVSDISNQSEGRAKRDAFLKAQINIQKLLAEQEED